MHFWAAERRRAFAMQEETQPASPAQSGEASLGIDALSAAERLRLRNQATIEAATQGDKSAGADLTPLPQPIRPGQASDTSPPMTAAQTALRDHNQAILKKAGYDPS